MNDNTSVRAQADALGIKYHHRAGDDTIQKLIDDHLAQDPNVMPEGVLSKEECAPMDPEEYRRKYNTAAVRKRDCERLIRCRIQCMDPQKKDWPGEIVSVGSAKLGTFKKYIPFNSPEPYHIPKIIYDMLKEKQCTVFYTDTDTTGKNKVRKGRLVNAYQIEVLDPLTPDELSELARKQALQAGQQ